MADFPFGSTVGLSPIITEKDLEDYFNISPTKTGADGWVRCTYGAARFVGTSNSNINIRLRMRNKATAITPIDLVINYTAYKINGVVTEKATVQSFGLNDPSTDVIIRWINSGQNIGFFVKLTETNDNITISCEYVEESYNGIRENKIKKPFLWYTGTAPSASPPTGTDILFDIIKFRKSRMIYTTSDLALTANQENSIPTWTTKFSVPSTATQLAMPFTGDFLITRHVAIQGTVGTTDRIGTNLKVNGSLVDSDTRLLQSTSTGRDIRGVDYFRHLAKGDVLSLTVQPTVACTLYGATTSIIVQEL